jgi:sugar lactone lactonase YvrE
MLFIVAIFCVLALRTLAQTVITLAGGSSSGTTSGSTNGVGTAALFLGPPAVTVDTSGNIAVADQGSHKIRLIYPNRTVITLAGGSTNGVTAGSINGVGTSALFNSPRGVAMDAFGVVFVADQSNHKIRSVFPNLTVLTLAGGGAGGTALGVSNGVGSAALFNNPFGILVDISGNVVVADTENHKIRLIFPNRTVVTLAGGSTGGATLGFSNGVGTAALFTQPAGIAADTSGNVYVADVANNAIRLVYANCSVITLAGGFNQPRGVSVNTISGVVFATDSNNNRILRIFPNRTVATFAGGNVSGSTFGSSDGVGTAALFKTPRGVAVDAAGVVYVADTDNNKIRIIYPFSCSPGTFANFTAHSCALCPPGSFSATQLAPSCSPCAAGTFAKPLGSTSCEVCPGGHFCPAGTSSWVRLNCGRGSYCPEGSAAPIPCPIQVVPLPYASWEAHPMAAQGPAFLVDTAGCLNHCFWNSSSSGNGMLSKC